MTASDLIAEVQQAGGQIHTDGEHLYLMAPDPLPIELRERLRERKAEILAELRQRQAEYEAAQQIRCMREKGTVPEHYSAITICSHCGPVPIFPGVPETVEGCVWCFNRVKGLPMPRVRQRRFRPVVMGRTVAGVQVCIDGDKGERA
ncbi:MAG: hypothetical protein IT488_10490 [Gammaproteobacteria bacterium]|nr:hypothetical protein [Gammaproteobacteria bacterium]